MRYPEGCAAPGVVQYQCNTREPLSKLKKTSPPKKINVTSKSPVGDISVVTLIRTDTTLDHSQKAEKVWRFIVPRLAVYINVGHPAVHLARALCRAATSVLVASPS